MRNAQQLRKRIYGVRETAKVTHAMEVVASARRRRAEARALDARPYASQLSELIGVLLADGRIQREHILLVPRGAGAALVLHMTTDRGLCGSLNTRLNQGLARYILEYWAPVRLITVGRKGQDFAVRSRLDLVADFSGLGDTPGMADLMPVCRMAIDMFVSGEVGTVFLSYPRFVSTREQHHVMERLLPVDTSRTTSRTHLDYVIDPDPDVLLNSLLERYVEANVYEAYLELVASEYAARMVAMHNATNSARELGEDLTLELNKVRQSAVTSEICDVTAGAEALGTGVLHA